MKVCMFLINCIFHTVTNEPTSPEDRPRKEKVPSNKECAAPVFTKRENATLAQHIEILNWYHANSKNQSKTAKHFSPKYPNLTTKQPLVSTWVKKEAKWQEEWAQSSGGEMSLSDTASGGYRNVGSLGFEGNGR